MPGLRRAWRDALEEDPPVRTTSDLTFSLIGFGLAFVAILMSPLIGLHASLIALLPMLVIVGALYVYGLIVLYPLAALLALVWLLT